MKFVPVSNREQAIVWTVLQLGLPEGFAHLTEYIDYVNTLMDEAEYDECYVVDDRGNYCAYFAWCYSADIHHKGSIFDVTNVVVKPGTNCASKVWREIIKLAREYECEWLSRCSHEADGSIKNHFRRINHG